MLSHNLGEVHKRGLHFMSDLYKRIESLCKSQGSNVTVMCKESGANRASLSDLKMGRKRTLSIETLSKIANHYGITVDYFLDTPPFDCWELINANRKNFLSYVPISKDVLSVIWGIDIANPEKARDRDFICFLSAVVVSATPTADGDWDVVIKPEYMSKKQTDVLDNVDLAFYGDYKELDEDDKETVRDMVRVMRERRLRKQEK